MTVTVITSACDARVSWQDTQHAAMLHRVFARQRYLRQWHTCSAMRSWGGMSVFMRFEVRACAEALSALLSRCESDDRRRVAGVGADKRELLDEALRVAITHLHMVAWLPWEEPDDRVIRQRGQRAVDAPWEADRQACQRGRRPGDSLRNVSASPCLAISSRAEAASEQRSNPNVNVSHMS